MSDKENSAMDLSGSMDVSSSRLNETDRSEVRKKYKTILDKISVEDGSLTNTQDESINTAMDNVIIIFLYFEHLYSIW